MKVRLGTLRQFLHEALLLEECGCSTNRWLPSDELEETDDRMVGDNAGPGEPDEDHDIAAHLRTDADEPWLGDALQKEIRQYFLQEDAQQGDSQDSSKPGEVDPATSPDSNPTSSDTNGFYTSFDMARDHTGDTSSTWYRSPGQEPGSAGDPFRSEDPYAQLGFHPPKTGNATPPGADGGEGTQLAPPIWQLSAGGDTSKVLGANAKPASGGGESSDGSKESEAPGGTDGDDGNESENSEESGETEGEESRGSDSRDSEDGQDVQSDSRQAKTRQR